MRLSNRSLFKPKKCGSYRMENKADEATMYLYDEISWFGISAEQFVKDLNDVKAGTIHLHVNSPGGSVFDGTTIYNAIKQHKSKVIAHIDGLAASIASVIVMAADEIKMSENAYLMIHEPWSMVIGNSDDMRKEADLLEKVRGTIAKTYMDRSGKEESEILDMMAAETWMTAKEALEMGFIDSVDENKNEKAKAALFDLSAFANVPDTLKSDRRTLTAREVERILRDGGCPEKMAKAIVAEGFNEDQRDVEFIEESRIKADQRDVDHKPVKKDRIAELLTRAEIVAPSMAA